MEKFEHGEDISKQASKQASNITLKKSAFYFLSLVLIPLALFNTVVVCMSSVLRFVSVDSFREAFGDDLDLEGIMNVFRIFLLIGYTCKHLIEAPFYLLGQILASPVLAFAWIKSAFVGFARLADFVCSDKKEILASNRLNEISQAKASEYDGIDVKSGSKAIFGYGFGILDFDVNRSSSSKPEAPKIEAQFFGQEGWRIPGRKWM